MTAAAQPYRRPSILPVLVLLAVVMLAVMLSVAHVIERHGVDGLNAYNCSIGSDNLLQHWIKPDGRDVFVCDVNGKFGIVVEEKGNVITAFIKDKFARLEQVERYLINSGAQKLW